MATPLVNLSPNHQVGTFCGILAISPEIAEQISLSKSSTPSCSNGAQNENRQKETHSSRDEEKDLVKKRQSNNIKSGINQGKIQASCDKAEPKIDRKNINPKEPQSKRLNIRKPSNGRAQQKLEKQEPHTNDSSKVDQNSKYERPSKKFKKTIKNEQDQIYKRKTCKIFQIIESIDLQTKPADELIGAIDANRYQQVPEQHMYADGRKEMMYKVFKSSKKLNQGKDVVYANVLKGQEEKPEDWQKLQQWKFAKKASIIAGEKKRRKSRFSELNKEKLQKMPTNFIVKTQSQEFISQNFSEQTERVQKIKNISQNLKRSTKLIRYMSARRNSHSFRLLNLQRKSAKFDLISIANELCLNCNQKKTGPTKEKMIEKDKEKKKYYKWKNWRVNYENRPKQQLIFYEIHKKIIEKEERDEIECMKKVQQQYQELHKLLYATNQIRKMKQNQNLINEIKEDSCKRVDQIFTRFQREISVRNSAENYQNI